MSDTDDINSGFYLILSIKSNKPITTSLVNGEDNSVKQIGDGIYMYHVTDAGNQSIKISSGDGSEECTKLYKLSNLVLEDRVYDSDRLNILDSDSENICGQID